MAVTAKAATAKLRNARRILNFIGLNRVGSMHRRSKAIADGVPDFRTSGMMIYWPG